MGTTELRFKESKRKFSKEEQLAHAIAIASHAHLSQRDKSGAPYILHCLWVMDRVRHLGYDHMIVAVLHDLMEDTDYTLETLKQYGFSEDVMTALNYLNSRRYKNYDDYIHVLATNKIAREVKLRDLEHNSKITRLKGLTKKDFDRMEKYHRSYTYLQSI